MTEKKTIFQMTENENDFPKHFADRFNGMSGESVMDISFGRH